MSVTKKNTGFNAAQQEAVNPMVSAFVQANAGTGKTAVLTGRLLHILFSMESLESAGVLCLTYTKAGASEMNNRILREMRKLAMADDKDLAELVYEIIKPRTVTEQDVLHARNIFYTYIDNPDILKVKTIHGFCEEILHRFPLEAGLSPAWNLVTDSMQNRLWREAFFRLINNAKRNPTDSDRVLTAFERILDTMSDSDMSINNLLTRLSKQYKYFFKFENSDNYRKYFVDTTKKILNIKPVQNDDFSIINLQEIVRHAEMQAAKTEKIKNIITFTKQYIDKTIDFEKYKTAYLTQTGSIRKKLTTDEVLLAEQERVYVIDQQNQLKNVLDDIMTLFDLSAEFAKTYKQIKRERNLLDFEDLILYTQRLFSNQDTMGWVLSQLNISINHILVDEAQDTGPDQWDVITSLVSTIMSVSGYDKLPPSTFVVGDTKQSIYSFQGADPEKFASSRQVFERQIAESRLVFKEPVLDINYRSTEPILHTVDEVFNNIPGFINNAHRCSDFNRNKPGLVEVHKITDACKGDITLSRYLDSVVDKIQSLITNKECLASDIMVLVRNRAPMTQMIVKKMKSRGIDVAGSDVIVLSEFSVVRDLLHLVRFCIDNTNDYSLCCVLKSPIFRLNQGDIYKICQIKNKENKLRRAQDKTTSPITVLEILEQTNFGVFKRLVQMSEWANNLSAYSFFVRVLADNNTRKNMISALGTQIIEPLEEFMSLCLSYERTEPGTMRDFIKWFVTSNSTIKRDVNQSGGVRVITVHGSKGLQSKVVFMIDTATLPYNDPNDVIQLEKHTMKKLGVTNNETYPLPWITRVPTRIQSDNLDIVRADTNDSVMAEYYRLLYVAMTRACQRLYIYGCRAKTTHGGPDTWIARIWDILSRDVSRFTDETHTIIRITNEK